MSDQLPAVFAPAAPLAPLPTRRPLIDAWLEGKAATTQRAYASDLDYFARWFDPSDEATDAKLERFLGSSPGQANETALAFRNAMLTGGLSSATVSRRLAAIKSLVKLARQLGRVAWSIEVAKPKSEPRFDRSGPDDSARRRLWRSLAKGDSRRQRRDRAVFALLFDMAMRRGEVVSLALADVDLQLGTVAVVRKGKREKTTLRLPTATRRELEGWCAVRGSEPGPLFLRTDRDGSLEPLSGEAVRLIVRRAGAAAGLAGPIRPHGMRHAALTHGADLGKPLLELSAFAGHARPETTMGYIDRTETKVLGVAEAVSRERRR
jgi:integrase/recombinase XerC